VYNVRVNVTYNTLDTSSIYELILVSNFNFNADRSLRFLRSPLTDQIWSFFDEI
jgi:hypothetical protein